MGLQSWGHFGKDRPEGIRLCDGQVLGESVWPFQLSWQEPAGLSGVSRDALGWCGQMTMVRGVLLFLGEGARIDGQRGQTEVPWPDIKGVWVLGGGWAPQRGEFFTRGSRSAQRFVALGSSWWWVRDPGSKCQGDLLSGLESDCSIRGGSGEVLAHLRSFAISESSSSK